ncbi:hypothetical protein [Dongia sedimenti]|uniref:DUF1254 domain-containing protein n=1 Tax=Dongia sedimenti TaxID=3064282 RepID=A0ABU0YSP4_9PROT|nr:hypothetical protein [Rhodospirillaceae bacterium R-7]
MKPYWFALISIAGLGLIAYWLLAGTKVAVVPSGYEKAAEDHAVFYRLRAKYLHGSEPVDFDIVVGCGVHVTVYQDNDSSYDAVRDPLIFAKATADGGAVMQIVPMACRGETTANGEVPADLLPGAVWFDDKSDLSFGIGYVTEDAFLNPRAKLKFLGASISAASRSDWDAFQPIAATNLMTSRFYTYGFPPAPSDEIKKNLWNAGELKKWSQEIGCYGVRRIKLTEPAQRAVVRKFWPSDKPRYWSPWTTNAELEAIEREIGQAAVGERKTIMSNGAPLREYKFVSGFQGFPTKAGGGVLSPYRERPGEIYPYRSWSGLPWLDRRTEHASELFYDIEEDGGRNLGFVYCYSSLRPGEMLDLHFPDTSSRHWSLRVDGVPVVTKDQSDSAFGTGIRVYFFENDEYLYVQDFRFSFS